MGIHIDTGSMKSFFDRLGKAGSGELKSEITTWMDGLGVRFLSEVQNEVIARGAVDYGRLLGSFTKGAAGNIFEQDGDGLSITVGTNVEYARYVEEGHQQSRRFVPGSWGSDGRFHYGEGKGGMMLTEKWIPGRFFFDGATRVFEMVLPKEVEAKMRAWVAKYF